MPSMTENRRLFLLCHHSGPPTDFSRESSGDVTTLRLLCYSRPRTFGADDAVIWRHRPAGQGASFVGWCGHVDRQTACTSAPPTSASIVDILSSLPPTCLHTNSNTHEQQNNHCRATVSSKHKGHWWSALPGCRMQACSHNHPHCLNTSLSCKFICCEPLPAPWLQRLYHTGYNTANEWSYCNGDCSNCQHPWMHAPAAESKE